MKSVVTLGLLALAGLFSQEARAQFNYSILPSTSGSLNANLLRAGLLSRVELATQTGASSITVAYTFFTLEGNNEVQNRIEIRGGEDKINNYQTVIRDLSSTPVAKIKSIYLGDCNALAQQSQVASPTGCSGLLPSLSGRQCIQRYFQVRTGMLGNQESGCRILMIDKIL